MALMRRFEETAIILGECPLLTALFVVVIILIVRHYSNDIMHKEKNCFCNAARYIAKLRCFCIALNSKTRGAGTISFSLQSGWSFPDLYIRDSG